MNARQIGWDNLEVFLASARTGSFTGAAQQLNVNHATVSRRIAKLEDELGTRLFNRSQTGCELTAAGDALLQHVVAIERQVQAIGRTVVGRDQRLEGVVRIATVDDLAYVAIPSIVAGFRSKHPGVSVQVHVESAFTDLAKMHADIAIRFGGRPQEPDLVSRRVASAAMWLYASREYLEEHPVPRVPADLAEHDIVRGSPDMSTLAVEALVDEFGDPSRMALRSSSMLTRAAAVRRGVGLGFLSPFAAALVPELVQVEMDLPPFEAWIWMVLHKDIRSNARVRAFADFAYDWLVDHRDTFH